MRYSGKTEPIWLQIKNRRRRKAKLRNDAERLVAAANIVHAQAYRNYDPRVLQLIAAAPYGAKINVRKDRVILSYDAHRAPYNITPVAYDENYYLQELQAQAKLEEEFKNKRRDIAAQYQQLRLRGYSSHDN